ncbi:MAG: AAA family ATPase [Spirochaetes bacterium]|nr:AAA family ATPase [Spirochaetota bacterium]
MAVKQRIEKILEQLNAGLYEKESAMALALLSSIAGESIFLLGPPGVAKSLIARRLKYAYKGANAESPPAFEYLMSRFSTPDEIFGPVRISKLKEDKYERQTEGYLPGAWVVFLDEIWKAGPSIQNALLTVLNEKLYRNGTEEKPVPMKALVSASNELPAKDQGLEALWDRFLVRLVVEGVEQPENFNKMITAPQTDFERNLGNEITAEEYSEWSGKIAEITVPENVLKVIDVIRKKIEQYNQNEEIAEKIYVSDRRWVKIVRLLRTSAFLNDRAAVDLMDCFLLKHCIWNEEGQIQAISEFVNSAVEEHGYTVSIDFGDIKKELVAFQAEIDEETKFAKDTRVKVLAAVRKDYYEILNRNASNGNLIERERFKKLTNNNENIYLCYWNNSYKSVRQQSYTRVRKGNSQFTIFVDDKEYSLKTKTDGEKLTETRKPNEYTEKAWDERISNFQTETNDMKSQIDEYRNKDLQHLRTNLFVAPASANIVETHISNTLNEIDKIEIEIKGIQNAYKKLKDEEIVVKD